MASLRLTNTKLFNEFVDIVKDLVDDPKTPQKHKDALAKWFDSRKREHIFDWMWQQL